MRHSLRPRNGLAADCCDSDTSCGFATPRAATPRSAPTSPSAICSLRLPAPASLRFARPAIDLVNGHRFRVPRTQQGGARRRSTSLMRCCVGDGGAGRWAGGPPRPPCRGRPQTTRAAAVKSRGGERRRKRRAVSASGVGREDERWTRVLCRGRVEDVRRRRNQGRWFVLG